MKGLIRIAAGVCLGLSLSGTAAAAPAICDDIGPTLAVGVSHFSADGDWPVTAEQQYGVDWRFVYVYVVPGATASWIQDQAAFAQEVGAIPVFTFYELLKLGQASGLSGTEPDVVQQVLGDASLMRSYFGNFKALLQVLASLGTESIVQVEPDSWGFMIWAMGVNGNPDATSVHVEVAGSGDPDVAGFPDHAGGLGQAMLALRDQYAPGVRLGWHASNFREGTGGDIVASFYGSMGPYDLLFSEEPHCEADPSEWWLPWDETKVETNLGFYSTLTSAAQVPMVLWQMDVGTADFHLFPSDPTMRTRFAEAGVAGALFDMEGTGDPDGFRADDDPALATVPPASSGAGGTAADMRARLAAYARQPLAWPPGSICAGASGAGASSGASFTSDPLILTSELASSSPGAE